MYEKSYLLINCLKNYNKRLSLNLNETRSEDISISMNKEIKKLFKEIEFKFKLDSWAIIYNIL